MSQTSQIGGLTPAIRLQTSKVSELSGPSGSDNFRRIRHLVTFLMYCVIDNPYSVAISHWQMSSADYDTWQVLRVGTPLCQL